MHIGNVQRKINKYMQFEQTLDFTSRMIFSNFPSSDGIQDERKVVNERPSRRNVEAKSYPEGLQV